MSHTIAIYYHRWWHYPPSQRYSYTEPGFRVQILKFHDCKVPVTLCER